MPKDKEHLWRKHGWRSDYYAFIIIDHRGENKKFFYRYKLNVIDQDKNLIAYLGEKGITTWSLLRDWVKTEKFEIADTVPFTIFYREANSTKQVYVVQLDKLGCMQISQLTDKAVDIWREFRNEK